jgi:pimeloyl-ACP methyl ester carboxylesterase
MQDSPAPQSSALRGLTRRGMLRATVAAGVAAVPIALGSAPAVSAATSASTPDGRLTLPPATEEVTRLQVHVPDAALDDLRRRLADARFPERELVNDWSQGAPISRVRRLTEYWQHEYDWRRLESKLDGLGQFRTKIDGLGIHFLHVRSRHAGATPLLLTHGWPGSIIEFLGTVGPLTDPTAHGGAKADAFHLVIPSIPGFGFSDRPIETGWNTVRIAKAWAQLMDRLGYREYLAQGGDWGGGITTQLGKLRPVGLRGVHLNFPEYVFSPPVEGEPTPAEQAALAQINYFFTYGAGYHREQSTRPQTIGYALTDSPVGQAAWIYEKFGEWTDSGYNPEGLLGLDAMLDDISLYWLTGTAASSARLYWEDYSATAPPLTILDLPVGVSVFPKEIVRTPLVWAERAYHDLVYFNDQIPRGGHFAAFEQPQLFAEELRAFAGKLR